MQHKPFAGKLYAEMATKQIAQTRNGGRTSYADASGEVGGTGLCRLRQVVASILGRRRGYADAAGDSDWLGKRAGRDCTGFMGAVRDASDDGICQKKRGFRRQFYASAPPSSSSAQTAIMLVLGSPHCKVGTTLSSRMSYHSWLVSGHKKTKGQS